jgi:tRNA nucleotidyltransferase (CCA-adding enzyme)
MVMKPDEYLALVLSDQELGDDSQELNDLQTRRDEVETLLRNKFRKASPTIRYGGSKAKGTLNRESYDLDLICHFPAGDTSAGETLADVYQNVHDALKTKYGVTKKTSAIRLRGSGDVDFHVDVVPGRFTDDTKSDAYLYRAIGEKSRLKTNLDLHIRHVRDSGVTEAIRLMKLWRERNAVAIRSFAIELVPRPRRFDRLPEAG